MEKKTRGRVHGFTKKLQREKVRFIQFHLQLHLGPRKCPYVPQSGHGCLRFGYQQKLDIIYIDIHLLCFHNYPLVFIAEYSFWIANSMVLFNCLLSKLWERERSKPQHFFFFYWFIFVVFISNNESELSIELQINSFIICSCLELHGPLWTKETKFIQNPFDWLFKINPTNWYCQPCHTFFKSEIDINFKVFFFLNKMKRFSTFEFSLFW